MDYQENCYKRGTLPNKAYSRVEQYLRELCLLEDAPLPIPQSRIELLLEAIFTGDVSKCESPKSREEKLIWALLTGDESDIEKCASRIEVLWYCLVKGLNAEELLGTEVNGKVIEDCMSRIEAYLWYLVKNGGSSLMGVEYELYDFVTTYNTINTNILKAVSHGETMVNIISDEKVVSDVQSVVGYGNMLVANDDTKYKEEFNSAILNGCTIKQLTTSNTVTQKTNNAVTVDLVQSFEVGKKYWVVLEPVQIGTQTTPSLVKFEHSSSNGSGFLDIPIEDFAVGKKVIKEFTPTNATTNVKLWYRNLDTTGGAWVTKISVFEIDPTNITTPFYLGLKSVKMPILTTTGKNLFDGEYELDKYLEKDGTPTASADWATTKNHIRVKPNTTYTQNIHMGSPIVYVVFYDKNKNIIGAETGYNLNNFSTYTTPDNCYYIKTCYKYSTVGNHLFQVEEGSISTSYEPYKSNILSCLEDVELRGIGDVKDTLDVTKSEGNLVESIGEFIYDGTNSSSTLIQGAYSAILKPSNKINGSKGFICDTVPQGIPSDSTLTHGIYENPLNFVIWDKTVTSSSEFRLKYQNVKILYELEEKVIKTVDLSIVDQDENTIDSIKPFTNGHIITSSDTLNPELEYTLVESNKFNIPALESKEYTVQNDGTNFILNDVEYSHGITEKTFTDTYETLTVIPNGYNTDGYEKFVIEGQTYQNILPEPTLRNSMTNVEMQKFNEGYDDVNVVDGVAKSAILEGMTLVNLIPTYDRTMTLSSDYSDFYAVGQASYIYSSGLEIMGAKALQDIKPNTTYTLIYNIVENTLSTGGYHLNNAGSNTIFPMVIIKQGMIGWQKTTFTSHSDLTGRYCVLRGQNGMGRGTLRIKDVMLIEGDYTNVDIPYFEGMQSVRMPVLTTTGKNICDMVDLANKLNKIDNKIVVIDESTWEITSTASYYNADFAYRPTKFKENTSYTVSFEGRTDDSRDNLANIIKIIYTNGTSSVMRSIGFNELTTPSNKTIDYISFPYGVVGVKETISNLSIVEGESTTYEPYKSNILSCLEHVELGSVGDVQDTLNLLTGEVVESTGETVLDGSSDESWVFNSSTDTTYNFYCSKNGRFNTKPQQLVVCDKLPSSMYDVGIKTANSTGGFSLTLPKTTVANNVTELKNFLSQNPLTVRYILAEKVHKTVDLSSYGNWEKIVLDGSEDENIQLWNSNANGKAPDVQGFYVDKALGITGGENYKVICDELPSNSSSLTDNNKETIYISGTGKINANISNSKLETLDLDGLKSYLSTNPITVWYQTATSQENSITEVLSFSNGHIQLSSEEGSLIPSLDYEVPTSNSYHMDLLKNNVVYTMKCENPNGKLLAKDSEITIQENRTIQIGLQYMPDDKLFINTGSWTNPMIIEGDFTSTTLPYFTGIKSAFEGESKIEVLSTGKNLVDVNLINEELGENSYIDEDNKLVAINSDVTKIPLMRGKFKENTSYTLSYTYENVDTAISRYRFQFRYTDGSAEIPPKLIKGNGSVILTSKSNKTIDYLWCTWGTDASKPTKFSNIQLEEGSVGTSYEPHKSINLSTNEELLLQKVKGVEDTLNITTHELTQRVGKIVIDGSDDEGWVTVFDSSSYGQPIYATKINIIDSDNEDDFINDKIANQGINFITDKTIDSAIYINKWENTGRIGVKTSMTLEEFKVHLSQKPITIIYKLKTPIIKNIDLQLTNQDGETVSKLEYFNNGHIFYETEFPPQTTYKANINNFKGTINVGTVKNNLLTATDKDIIIVEGDKSECYIPKFKGMISCTDMSLKVENEDGSNVLTQYPVNKDVVIRKIKDIEDTFNYLTGEYTRRIGEITFDGSENWETSPTGNGKFIGIVYIENGALSNIYDDKEYQLNNRYLFCKDPYANNLNSCWLHKVDNNTTQFRLMLDGTQTLSDEFKEYVTNNPITIQYALAEPIITKVDMSLTKEEMRSFDGITKFRVEKNDSELFPSKTVVTVRTSNDTDLALLDNGISTLSLEQNDTSNTISNTSEDIENVSNGLNEINSLLEE